MNLNRFYTAGLCFMSSVYTAMAINPTDYRYSDLNETAEGVEPSTLGITVGLITLAAISVISIIIDKNRGKYERNDGTGMGCLGCVVLILGFLLALYLCR